MKLASMAFGEGGIVERDRKRKMRRGRGFLGVLPSSLL